MPGSTKSLVKATGNIKPMSIFYIWYVELCRRSNTNPISTIRSTKPKNEHVLDFTADRIKCEEWTPIVNALRLDTSLHIIALRSRIVGCKFLNEVNTEEKARRLAKANGALWTDYILKSVMRSLGCCLANTNVLSALELEGLPLYKEYFDMLLENLKGNKTIKSLSLKRCPIGDVGCFQLCLSLNSMIHIECLNLSGCQLTSISGQHIAKVIKFQQINRYCESWQKSLRYEEPDSGLMAGLKRITLNNNPELGDEGLCYILNELDDDLWIKALDMQKCNITENMARRITDVVEYSRSLEVADFRNNNLCLVTMQQILDALNRKQPLGMDAMYQWCTTTSTLYDFISCTPRSNMTELPSVQKSKSAPLRELELIPKYNQNHALRRTRTLTLVQGTNKLGSNPLEIKHIGDAKKQLLDLNSKLQHEIFRRKEAEKMSTKFKQQLDNINKIGQEGINNKYASASQIIKSIHSESKDHISTTSKEKYFRKEVKPKKPTKKMKPKSAKQRVRPKNGDKVMLKQENGKQLNNGSIAQNIFEQFLKAGPGNDNVHEDKEDLANLLTYVCNGDSNSKVPDKDMLSSSCSSLEKLLHEITFLEDDPKLLMENPASSSKTTKGTLPKNSRDANAKNQIKKHVGKVR